MTNIKILNEGDEPRLPTSQLNWWSWWSLSDEKMKRPQETLWILCVYVYCKSLDRGFSYSFCFCNMHWFLSKSILQQSSKSLAVVDLVNLLFGHHMFCYLHMLQLISFSCINIFFCCSNDPLSLLRSMVSSALSNQTPFNSHHNFFWLCSCQSLHWNWTDSFSHA